MICWWTCWCTTQARGSLPKELFSTPTLMTLTRTASLLSLANIRSTSPETDVSWCWCILAAKLLTSTLLYCWLVTITAFKPDQNVPVLLVLVYHLALYICFLFLPCFFLNSQMKYLVCSSKHTLTLLHCCLIIELPALFWQNNRLPIWTLATVLICLQTLSQFWVRSAWKRIDSICWELPVL